MILKFFWMLLIWIIVAFAALAGWKLLEKYLKKGESK